MSKKEKSAAKKDAGLEIIKSEYAKLPVHPVPLNPHNGENTIEFNSYNVVYSNNVSGNLSSAWRAGVTEIGCYKDNAFVGVIAFYETTENLHGGYIDANGVVVIEYPIGEFEDVMHILQTFTNLYLLLVEKDQQGTPLAHPVGAVMTFEKKPVGA